MAKTISEYIEERRQREIWYNRNIWNDHKLAHMDRLAENQYQVYPDDDGTDKPRNPYPQT